MEQDNILYPSEPLVLSHEEVTGGLGLLLAGIVKTVEKKAAAIAVAEDPLVTDSTEQLVRRISILGNGIKPSANGERLYKFMERAKDAYGLSTSAIETYVDDGSRLTEMIGRVGIALQGDMHVNKMLTADAKRKLEALDRASADDVN